MTRRWLWISLLLSGTAWAAGPLPDYLKLPPQAQLDVESVTHEDYGEAEIWVHEEAPDVFRGRRISFNLRMPEADDSSAAPMIESFKAALGTSGWTVARDARQQNPGYASFRYQKGGKSSILGIWFFNRDDLRAELIEIAGQKTNLVLKPPAGTPEKAGAQQDFPYLTPPPGAKLESTDAEGPPMFVTLPGEQEATLVASGSMIKSYMRPDSLSHVEFATLYREALTGAGWQILQVIQGTSFSDATIEAHYAKNGRDLWAVLHQGGSIELRVADVGTQNWSAQLKKDCRLPLYGVNFDFNKATLRADSEVALGKAAQAVKDNPALKVEVQGHTDHVGNDAYNLKLSEARAQTVMQWLRAHGADPARLSTRGYGRGQPVADNDSAEGRARNRRVELACMKQGSGS